VLTGFRNIRERALFFEPSFPVSHFYPDSRREDAKRNFLFYARPTNLRNLYYRGLEIIDQCIRTNILDQEKWNFFFVGKDLTEVTFPRGVRPRLIQNLEWRDYAALVRRVDLGLCLMYTPHPSYPPLDLAATGAVAVTNRFETKQSLDMYSRNIICTEIDIDSMVKGMQDGVALAGDEHARFENYEDSPLLRDWKASFETVLRSLSENCDRVRPQPEADKILRSMDQAARA
jgi:hypothetical protein